MAALCSWPARDGAEPSAPPLSDWMELEKQRGISVGSTVLQSQPDGYQVNLLDTPGHRDSGTPIC